eukprot:3742309-Lingulodinium_polyedra.AAC.1
MFLRGCHAGVYLSATAGLLGNADPAVCVVGVLGQHVPDLSRGVDGAVLEELLDLPPDPSDGVGAADLWRASDHVHAGPGLSNPDSRVE